MKKPVTVIIAALCLIAVIVGTSLAVSRKKQQQDEQTQTTSSAPISIDSGEPDTVLNREDFKDYNIPEDAVIIDEKHDTAQTDSGTADSQTQYNLPEGAVIVDESDSVSDSQTQYNLPDGAVIVDESGSSSGGYNLPAGAVIVDEGGSSSNGYNIPEGSVIIDGSGSSSGGYNIPSGSVIIDEKSSGSGKSSGNYGNVVTSGSFASSSGTALNLHLDYVVTAVDAYSVRVDTSVYISSGSLQAKASYGAVTVNCAGSSKSLSAPAINYNGSSIINTQVGTSSFTVPIAAGSSTTINISASWYFGGRYSGISINNIGCGGSVRVTR